jgi:hypothetical protein
MIIQAIKIKKRVKDAHNRLCDDLNWSNLLIFNTSQSNAIATATQSSLALGRKWFIDDFWDNTLAIITQGCGYTHMACTDDVGLEFHSFLRTDKNRTSA